MITLQAKFVCESNAALCTMLRFDGVVQVFTIVTFNLYASFGDGGQSCIPFHREERMFDLALINWYAFDFVGVA